MFSSQLIRYCCFIMYDILGFDVEFMILDCTCLTCSSAFSADLVDHGACFCPT
jgi:hypothetical protein